MKKILSLVMVLALILSCLCLPASADVKYNVTLRVEVFDRSIAGLNLEDCWQLRYAQENFGDPNGIKLQFVPVSRWEEGDILTTQISGQTAADICITYNGDLVNALIADDGVYALDDLIAKYGDVPERDMFNTYNMGVGMSVVVPAEQVDTALEILKANGEDAYVIGSIIESEEKVILE